MELKGSFIGFTYGGVHSSKLGIFRTTTSNRNSIELHSPTTDKLITIDGLNENYYFGSSYRKKDINISYAFYGLSEEQIKQLKQIFSSKQICSLILDEEPYKVWSVKVTGNAICKHLCFEVDGQRIYHGEGTLVFTAFFPFARSRYEFLDDYTFENIREWIDPNGQLAGEAIPDIIYPAILSYGEEITDSAGRIVAVEQDFQQWLTEMELLMDSEIQSTSIESSIDFFADNGMYYNLEEWAEASCIPYKDGYGYQGDGQYNLYNAGDLPISFKLYLPQDKLNSSTTLVCGENTFTFSSLQLIEGDAYLLYDGTSCMLKGCNEMRKETGTIYNKYITSGNFFKLPTGEIQLTAPEGEMEYKYLYL